MLVSFEEIVLDESITDLVKLYTVLEGMINKNKLVSFSIKNIMIKTSETTISIEIGDNKTVIYGADKADLWLKVKSLLYIIDKQITAFYISKMINESSKTEKSIEQQPVTVVHPKEETVNDMLEDKHVLDSLNDKSEDEIKNILVNLSEKLIGVHPDKITTGGTLATLIKSAYELSNKLDIVNRIGLIYNHCKTQGLLDEFIAVLKNKHIDAIELNN